MTPFKRLNRGTTEVETSEGKKIPVRSFYYYGVETMEHILWYLIEPPNKPEGYDYSAAFSTTVASNQHRDADWEDFGDILEYMRCRLRDHDRYTIRQPY